MHLHTIIIGRQLIDLDDSMVNYGTKERWRSATKELKFIGTTLFFIFYFLIKLYELRDGQNK